MSGHRHRFVEEHHDADLGRSWIVYWDTQDQCYTVADDDGDPVDSFDSLADARAAVRAELRALREEA